MKNVLFGFKLLAAMLYAALAGAEPLGLPRVPLPPDNPQTPEKIALGKKLFEDQRFSSTGAVSCATCHDPGKAFTDSPLPTSQGIHGAVGTRNAPTVINTAFLTHQFWDGRSPSLEDQAQHPFVNPIEMGLPDHAPILKLVRSDPEYVQAFKAVFGKEGEAVTLKEVTQAIASFERTVLSGDSPFDRYYFGGNKEALSPAAIRGFQVFLGEGRCVSCHVIEQDNALFTDNRFHNIGVGMNRIQDDVPRLAGAFLDAKARGADVDVAVLSDKKSSELGRFAVTDQFDELGAFKTPTLREVANTAPYMHDGSLKTLREKVTVIYGHVHQIQYNQIGNISFNSVMATAWPWPYPTAYKQAVAYLPKLTVPMNRADPFHERDATGWQFINLASGNADLHYTLYDNPRRVVAFNAQTGQPEDTQYQAPESRIPPQNHY